MCALLTATMARHHLVVTMPSSLFSFIALLTLVLAPFTAAGPTAFAESRLSQVHSTPSAPRFVDRHYSPGIPPLTPQHANKLFPRQDDEDEVFEKVRFYLLDSGKPHSKNRSLVPKEGPLPSPRPQERRRHPQRLHRLRRPHQQRLVRGPGLQPRLPPAAERAEGDGMEEGKLQVLRLQGE